MRPSGPICPPKSVASCYRSCRISRLTSVLERPVLMSADFAQSIAQPSVEVGSFELKGIEGWQRVFAPA